MKCGRANITFTKHAEEQMFRCHGLSKETILKDIKRHMPNMKAERGGEKLKITGDIMEYILDRNLHLITILYRTRRRKKKKNRYRSVYLNEQWMNLDRSSIASIVDNSLIT